MGDCFPQGTSSVSEDEFNFEQAVSQIEAHQASQLPAYQELWLWNPESYARLTNRCYIIQDWNPRHSVFTDTKSTVLTPRIWMSSQESIDTSFGQLKWMDNSTPPVREGKIKWKQPAIIRNWLRNTLMTLAMYFMRMKNLLHSQCLISLRKTITTRLLHNLELSAITVIKESSYRLKMRDGTVKLVLKMRKPAFLKERS